MIEITTIFLIKQPWYHLLVTTHDPNIWNLFFLLFIIGTIFAILILTHYSKKPDEWRHKSVINDYYSSGRLKDLAESLKITPIDYKKDTPLKRFIQNIFFQKIQSMHNLTDEELDKLQMKDQKTLEDFVKDKTLVSWILNIYSTPSKSAGWFKIRGRKKDQYFLDLKTMIEKMETWEK